MRATLAAAALRRNPARTLLAILGVAVSAALLLDMVMLAGGMRESFRDLLLVRGYQLRVSPKGTLPFDTEATVDGASAIVAALRANPDIDAVSPVLGGQLHVIPPAGSMAADAPVATSVALGLDPVVQGDYTLLRGTNAAAADQLVVNDAFLQLTGRAVGDTLDAAAGFDPQMRAYSGRRRLVITGVARFHYTSAGQAVGALPIATLQQMRGVGDRASVFMARVPDSVDVERVRAWVQRTLPRVTAISTETAMAQVEERLGYFRQLAFILGAISLVIGFLLVTTLVTVSVNERVGEIAVQRALGVSRAHVVQQIVLEGCALSLAGALGGLALGLVTARYLNRILSDFPGLPAEFDFFLFQPAAAYRSLALLVVSGVLAGIYPAWRAASLPIAVTLRREAVA
jgi:putative ABC transport system permease protein